MKPCWFFSMAEDDNLLRAKQVLNRKECERLSDGLASEENKKSKKNSWLHGAQRGRALSTSLLHCQRGCSFMARNKKSIQLTNINNYGVFLENNNNNYGVF